VRRIAVGTATERAARGARTVAWGARAAVRVPRVLRGLGTAGAAGLLALLMAGPAAAAGPAPGAAGAAVRPAAATGASTEGLVKAYAAARHLPPSAIAQVRPGSLRMASASGRTWAIAAFVPSAHASAPVSDAFQDGAGTGVFARTGGSAWRLVQTGPYGCGRGLPSAVRRAWDLASPASCQAAAAPERSAAARARAAARHAGGAAGTGGTEGLGQRIADIALSQVGAGATPAITSFAGVDCDPYSTLVAGFSANADGCGFDQAHRVRNENEEWCADFAKWVWQQAGVTADMNTLNAGAVSFYDWGLDQGESMPADAGTPAPGDAIVFFPPGKITPTSYADHVGIVTSVNPDGTIDMANGDFLGAGNSTVQYNTGISLTSWASQVWGPGEQWVIVSPPAGAQQPAPSAWIAGPRAAAGGTAVRFAARATEAGGSITRYYWTFGDGRSANTLGAQVSHVFAGNGIYPVTVTVTSSFGTIRTLVRDVDVLGASSAAASVPSDAVWFASTPVDQYLFVRSSSGGLAADTWDGASWLQQAVPGQLASGSGLTALSYPDPAAADATTPHAYFLSSAGTLAETYLGSSGWVTQQLAGSPAPGSAIVATTMPGGGVAVFYVTAGGKLAETSGQGTTWTVSVLPGPRAADPASLALADTPGGPLLFYTSGHGTLMMSPARGTGRPVARGVASGSTLAAVPTGTGGARVFFAARGGRLDDATVTGHGRPDVRTLPGSPAAAPLTATTFLLPQDRTGPVIFGLPTAPPSAGAGEEVFYLTAAGHPAVTYTDAAGGPWQATALPSTAASILGADAYQVAGQPSRLFLTGSAGPSADSAASPAGPWTAGALPATPATFADRVMLYAATPADRQAAAQAASTAGLPADQVTGSYATAWAATLSGDYLVIAVGPAAADALYFNPCGWANPSADPVGTPFYIVSGPLDHLPGADAYEDAAAATATQTPQLAGGLAYYAVHGTLPPGVTSLPAAAKPSYACAGSPS